MTEGPPLLFDCDKDGVASITLNRPAAGNSLSMELVTALRARLAELAERMDVKVIVVSGTGGRIFSAGHDLNEFHRGMDEEMLRRDFAGIAGLMQEILNQPQIVIAKVEGVATAAGCELVAACDLALAAETARFAVPGVNIGFWCHTPQVLLSRAIGRKRAMMMLATGRLFSAQHALSAGLVNELYPADRLDEAVASLAAQIASKPASVLRRGKRSFMRQQALQIEAAYDLVQKEALKNIADPDAKEGIGAFLGRRTPDWPSEKTARD